jgi:DNA helicase-2/ATP-dependent DNA helicase PcrA
LAETKYREWLVEDASEEGYERAANVDELVSACDEFDLQHPNDGGLEAFLEQAALVNDTDAWESDSDFVTLLTIHSSKGLEFPVVYIVGLEDGLIPHERSSTNDEELEEERRLLFVGITRAEQQLQLSRCLSRFRRNGVWPCIASRFLMELPREIMNCFEPAKSDPWSDQGDGFEPDLESVDPWLEDGFSSDEVKESPPRLKSSTTTAFPRLVTAAELEKKQDELNAIRLHPDRFQVGMQVEHPEYGVGQIVELSGSGLKRVATVDFPLLGKRRFRLSHSNLQPAGSDSH